MSLDPSAMIRQSTNVLHIPDLVKFYLVSSATIVSAQNASIFSEYFYLEHLSISLIIWFLYFNIHNIFILHHKDTIWKKTFYTNQLTVFCWFMLCLFKKRDPNKG
jgi:hypothetical protein